MSSDKAEDNKDSSPLAGRHSGKAVIPPGSVVGLLGGGQLGRMFALEARRLGYRVSVFDPSPESPAGQVADIEISGAWTDSQALRQFATGVDVVTYEFENIPVSAIEVVEAECPVRPNANVLHVAQNREREKTFLRTHGLPCAPFWVVGSVAELAEALSALGPQGGVLKTADFGYDGKGQVRVQSDDIAFDVWSKFNGPRGVLEGWVEYEKEFSVVCARSATGETAIFPLIENIHHRHILDWSLVPADIPAPAAEEAIRVATAIAEQLDVVGLITVECFLGKDGSVLVNELAPRPHNSGHYSFDACVTSQFEQQLRAVCGLPLGSVELLRPVVMRNILGDLWSDGEPDWSTLLAEPGAKLHLYGKSEARPGRKMGHLCVFGASVEDALARAKKVCWW